MIVPVPDVEFGICVAKLVGTVQALEVPTPVAIVPDAPPNEYFNVCVKLLDALGVLIVIDPPIVMDVGLTDGCVARAIVVRFMFPDTLIFPGK